MNMNLILSEILVTRGAGMRYQGTTHKNLDIWKMGIDLVEKIYLITQTYPREEIYGLRSQMRRAAISYPSNIAEGAARSSSAEFLKFLYYSLGSLAELETQIILSQRIGYLKNTELLRFIETLRKKHLNFIKYLKSKQKP